jgi:hypothetical protein
MLAHFREYIFPMKQWLSDLIWKDEAHISIELPTRDDR